MKLIKNGVVIADNLQMKDTFFGRLVGLLATPNLAPGEGIILKPCTQIHTFFMRYAIDVIFINRDGRALAVHENLKPWRLSPLYLSAYYTVELPANTLKNTIKEGDELVFEK